MATKPASPSPTLNMCPFFHVAQQERQYPLLGLCRALPRNRLMIPTLEEYRACCSAPGYTTCSVFRSGVGEIDEPDWLEIGYAEWAWRLLGGLLGGGFSLAEKSREATEFALLPRIGYVFAQQEYFLPGSFELVGEPTFLTVFQHQTVYVGGLAALLKYNIQTGTRWTPYFPGGGGASFASHRLPHGGTNFNFMPEGGLGLQYALTPRALLGLEWRFQHFSNANISPNPSLNMSLFLLGFSIIY